MSAAVAVVANELRFEHAGGLGIGDRPGTGGDDVGHAGTALAVDRIEADQIRALVVNHEPTLTSAAQPSLKAALNARSRPPGRVEAR